MATMAHTLTHEKETAKKLKKEQDATRIKLETLQFNYNKVYDENEQRKALNLSCKQCSKTGQLKMKDIFGRKTVAVQVDASDFLV